jgi:membrane protein required for colicin V production
VLTVLTKLDWVLVAITGVSVVFAVLKGLTRELVSLAVLVAGLVMACWFYAVPAAWLAPYVRTPEIASLGGFLAILLASMVAGGLLSKLAAKLVDKAGLRWFDRLLGGAFGLVRGLLLCLALLLGLAVFPAGHESLSRSRLAPYLLQGARLLVVVAPSDVRARFRSGLERLQKAWNDRQEL